MRGRGLSLDRDCLALVGAGVAHLHLVLHQLGVGDEVPVLGLLVGGEQEA